MSDNYPGTNVPFEGYALPDLHDPIVLGPGAESLQATSQVYGSLAETLDKAVGDLRAVLAKSQHAHQGQAADAARQHVFKVASAGEAGAEHARLATYALQEQAAYFSRARTDMQAAADTAATPVAPLHSAWKGGAVPNPHGHVIAEHARTVAVDGAHLYQNNSNHNLTYIFQGFDPPQISAPDLSVGPQPQAPGWGGGSLGTGTHAVTPAGTGAGSIAPAAPSAGAPGGSPAVPPLVGGPSPSAAPGFLPSTPASQVGRSGGRGDTSGTLPSPRSPVPTPAAASSAGPGRSGAGIPTDLALPGGSRAGGSLPGLGVGDPEPGRSGWVPGQPWTTRPGTTPPGAASPGSGSGAYRLGESFGRSPGGSELRTGAGAGSGSVAGRPSAPGVVEPGASATGPSSRASTPGQPFMPMSGAGGRGQGTEHRRPSWLVEDDPEALWMSGLPPHGPAVIEPLED